MSIFSRRPPEDTIPLREALRRADPDLAAELNAATADRFGVRNTLERKKAAHASLTDDLQAAIVRVYHLAEQHRASTNDLLEAAARDRADVEAKLRFIDEIERSLKGGNDASHSDDAVPAGDDRDSGAGGGQEGAVPGVSDTEPGGSGLQGPEAQVPTNRE